MSDRPSTLLIRHWTTIAWFAVIGVVLGAGLSFLRPLEYRSSIRLLITQESVSADAFTAAQSAERLADQLANIVFTTAFFEQVIEFGIDETQFPSEADNASKRRKVWRKMLNTSVQRGTGLLSIDVFNTDPSRAENISRAISFVLTQQGWRYVSGGNISVRLVDQPLISRYPVRPNVPVNAFVGLVLGTIIGGLYVFVRSEQAKTRRRYVA